MTAGRRPYAGIDAPVEPVPKAMGSERSHGLNAFRRLRPSMGDKKVGVHVTLAGSRLVMMW
ncbi:hypothetical protein SS05631_b55690 (plasmid) [Sinorhizobium sp. CCBAU 05631]|uniref:Uncharacterized protein n=1 Tax=Rhizobium fredii TaxID=380 RepID=A0A2L0HEG7_RHIFR|nr:hypothetical protein SS05631_b55690 [Sinorhizobium sp. CCBAU 05631]AUX79890.1 hypothetical protein NXT3_PC00729 [Sinorhizobium fredii]